MKSLNGGDPASTWVAKPEGHAEDVTTLVKNVAKHIVANKRSFALDINKRQEASNGSSFVEMVSKAA